MILHKAATVMVSEVNNMHFNQVNHFVEFYRSYRACINLSNLASGATESIYGTA
jgi:hypothetical protein